MNCVACGRPLFRFAVSVLSKAGPIGWGPKCAKRAGVTKPRADRARRVTHPTPIPVDPHQINLPLEIFP